MVLPERIYRAARDGDRDTVIAYLEAVGRLFGAGSTTLRYSGDVYERGEVEPAISLRNLVVLHTHGRLVDIDISYSAITDQNLVDMCRASPLLKTLRVILVPNFDRVVETIAGKIDEITAQVSRACPLLESVYLTEVVTRNRRHCRT